LGLNAVTHPFTNGVQKSEIQTVSEISSDQFAVDEKVIRIKDDDYWLYGAVDAKTTGILHFQLFFDDDETDDVMVSDRSSPPPSAQ
jgi:hypothetical protein